MPAPGRLHVAYWFNRSCPSHEEGLALLREAARAEGLELEVEALEVTDDEQAAALGFPGSPTYVVEGRDPFPREDLGAPPSAEACRAFPRPGGRVGPLPHRDDLAAALRAAARERAAA